VLRPVGQARQYEQGRIGISSGVDIYASRTSCHVVKLPDMRFRLQEALNKDFVTWLGRRGGKSLRRSFHALKPCGGRLAHPGARWIFSHWYVDCFITSTTRMARSLKAKTQHLTLCEKCNGELFRSDIRNFGEILIAPILLPFRCARCGWRQFRSSFSRVRDRNNYARLASDRE
jgi:hypothetical protein